MPKRQLQDWLDGYMDYTHNSEPPTSYHLWTGISTIAAALQRRVYMPFNTGRMHPNMFIILVGPSGRCRKGTAMSFAQDIIKHVDAVKVVAQSITPQMLVRDMQNSKAEFANPDTGIIEWHCSMTIMSGELSVFLGQGNFDFLALLTNLYDNEDVWEYRTKTGGQDTIKGVCLNFLGGTAPDWIDSMIPRHILGGGFTSRIIFIVEKDKAKIVPDPTPTPNQLRLRKALIHDLQQINLMAGECLFADDTLEMYEEWYIDQTNNPPFTSGYFEGYCARRATHIRKLSMIMSASRSSTDLIVRRQDLERAITVLEGAELRMPQAFTGLGKAKYAEICEGVMTWVIDMSERGKSRFTMQEVLQHFFPDIDTFTAKIALETLTEMGMLRLAELGGVSKVYELVPNFKVPK